MREHVVDAGNVIVVYVANHGEASTHAVDIPIVGIGGIACIDDVMQFLVTGASAVQIGTANYYDPHVSTRLVEQLPDALREIEAGSVAECVGTLS